MKRIVLMALGAVTLATSFASALEPFIGKADPLATCPVSGEVLGEMGEPVQLLSNGRDVRLCCAGCIKKFEADPAGFLSKMDDAIIAQQKPLYPMTTCPISGEKLGEMGEPISKVVGNQLVQLCCAGCEAKLAADPAAAVAKLDAATVAKQKDAYPFDTCVVSGEKLGEHGDPIDVVAGGRLVRLCCASCQAKLDANPSKFLQMIETGKLGAPEAEGSDPKADEHVH